MCIVATTKLRKFPGSDAWLHSGPWRFRCFLLLCRANYDHPEPMRIWVENTNGRGDMFFNFAPGQRQKPASRTGKNLYLKVPADRVQRKIFSRESREVTGSICKRIKTSIK